MAAEVALAVGNVPALDRVQQQAVLGVDHPSPARAADRHERSSVVLGGVPQPGHHGRQGVDAATGVAEQVELAVQLQEPADCGVDLDLFLELPQAAQLHLGEVRNALAQRERLEALAHLVDGVHLVRAQPGDPGTLVRLVLDEPLGLEHAQRLADRQPAGTQELGDLFLPDALAGSDVAAEDCRAQVVRDPLAGRGGQRTEAGGCRAHRGVTCACRSKALPSGYDTSSNCIPHGARKYTQRWPSCGPPLAVGAPRTVTLLALRWSTAASRSSTYRAMWWPPMSLLRGTRLRWSGAVYWNTSKIACPPQRKKRFSGMVARGCTPRCSLIQSPSSPNGPNEYRYSQPSTSTRNRVASSRSGTVKPTWSSRRRPGSPICCHPFFDEWIQHLAFILQEKALQAPKLRSGLAIGSNVVSR